MPVDPSYGRHYRGAPDREMQAGAWKCPSCGQSNTTPLEDGCPGCLAGTQEEVERARAVKLEKPLSVEDLAKFIVEGVVANNVDRDIVLLKELKERARLTLARALAHYGETGAPTPSELTRMQCLGWGRALADTID